MANFTSLFSKLQPTYAAAFRPAALLATVALLAVARPSQAQDVSRYTFAASSGTFTAITGGTVPHDFYVATNTLSANDGISEVITLPFTFMYGGVARTTLQATTDGYLDFRGTGTFSQSINGLDRGENTVAPFYDDLNGINGTASYTTTGTAPNRVFTFQWLNWSVGNASAPTSISFQVKLYETTNVVQYVYRPETGAPGTITASIGIGGNSAASGTRSNFISLSDASASPTVSTTSVNTISTRPALGQTYTFTPSVTTAARSAFEAGSLAAFPNPAKGSFTLRLPALATERTAQLTLLNSLGQTLQARSLALAPTGTETQVDVSNLPTGLYTVRVQAGSQVATQHLAVD
ncbi:MAG: T9SS type A sorting domain-containing protein [Hymenobacter sp.]|nr:MAG: T9SS type A sorting domain-containing protein [Hymenobacter sp.]